MHQEIVIPKEAAGVSNHHRVSDMLPTLSLKPATKITLLAKGESGIKFKCAISGVTYIRAISENRYVWVSLDSDEESSDMKPIVLQAAKDQSLLSLDEIAYEFAEWVCSRNSLVKDSDAVASWAKMNRVDLSGADIDYVLSTYICYIKFH